MNGNRSNVRVTHKLFQSYDVKRIGSSSIFYVLGRRPSADIRSKRWCSTHIGCKFFIQHHTNLQLAALGIIQLRFEKSKQLQITYKCIPDVARGIVIKISRSKQFASHTEQGLDGFWRKHIQTSLIDTAFGVQIVWCESSHFPTFRLCKRIQRNRASRVRCHSNIHFGRGRCQIGTNT